MRAVSILTGAGADTVTFASKAFLAQLAQTKAGACFLSPQDAQHAPAGCAVLLTPSPQRAYALAAVRLHRARVVTGHDAISASAQVESGVTLGPGVVIGAGAQVGRGTRIGATFGDRAWRRPRT